MNEIAQWVIISLVFFYGFAGRKRILHFGDGTGKIRAALGVQHGSPGLWLLDENGITRLSLILAENGNPQLSLNDTDGAARSVLQLEDKNGTPSLTFGDKNGDLHLMIMLSPEGSPRMIMMGQDRKVLWEAPE